MDMTRMKEARPRLGVVMIVKDEEKNLGHILADIKDVVDEIVVVDTGSSDRTVEIAKSFGVIVGHFTWCDDFSAARNVSIELATADYLLWLDADDRIYDESRTKLKTLKGNLNPEKNKAYFLRIHNTTDNRTDDTEALQFRLFPKINGARFEGRLHEQILPSLTKLGIPLEILDITIHHTGYHDAQAVADKGRRNHAIQLRALAEGNDTALQHFTLAMSCHATMDYEKCLEFIRNARWRSKPEKGHKSSFNLKYSFNLATECLVKLNRIDEAIIEAQHGVSHYPESGTMHYILGAVSLKAEQYDKAIDALCKATQLGIEVDDFPTPVNIAATLPQYLGTALEKTGKKAEAIAAYRKSLLNNPDWVPSLMLLGLALVSTGDIDEAILHLERAYNLASQKDLQLILSLCRLYRYKGREADAHLVYLDALAYFPDHPQILAGLALTSISADDVDRLTLSLESLMRQVGLETNRQIQDNSEFASLCAEVGRSLLKMGDCACAATLADAACMLDASCWMAQLLATDVSMGDNNSQLALAFLEKALRCGAPVQELEWRMKLLEE